MNEDLLLVELKKNCKQYGKELREMLTALDLTILGNDVQEQHFKDIYNRVLEENEFFAAEECSRGDVVVKKGDRITDESFTFLLSEEDFDRWQKISLPYCVEEDLVDENGYFITNWSMMVIEEKNKVFEFICKKVLPKEIGDFFYENRWNITIQNRVIDITKKSFVA